VTSALLLAIAGVPDGTIAQDYGLTARFLWERCQVEPLEVDVIVDPATTAQVTGPLEGALSAVLQQVVGRRLGEAGAAAWFEQVAAGLPAEVREQLAASMQPDGQGDGALLYFIAYPLGRFWVEFFRPDAWVIGQLATAQWIAIVCVIACVALLYVRHRGWSAQGNRDESLFALSKYNPSPGVRP